MGTDRVEGKNNFPKWMRVASFVVGFILMGDGMRRFAAPQEARDLHAFLMYILVGACCLLVTGYSRKLFLDKNGLTRETNIWGKKTSELLISLDKVERVVFSRQKSGIMVGLESGGKGYRIPIETKDEEAVQKNLARFANIVRK